jgi:predicted RNA binding protein YcfA (HicA-like mRNA interferase family)
MQRVIDGRTTTVPVPDYVELGVGTLPSIIRQSVYSEDENDFGEAH